MEQRFTATEADFTSFGNYLLSDERKAMTSEHNQQNVTHADFQNWLETQYVPFDEIPINKSKAEGAESPVPAQPSGNRQTINAQPRSYNLNSKNH